jgi:hypothetical protein
MEPAVITARDVVRVDSHMFYLLDSRAGQHPPPLPPNGLITALPGIAVIFTGASSGYVHVSVEIHHTPVPADPHEFAQWDEAVEQSMVSPGGDLHVAALSADPPDLPVLTPAGSGEYRIRIHARGRDTAPDAVAFDPVEEYHLLVWPQPVGPEVIHRQTDRYGASLRASTSVAAPPPRPTSEAQRRADDRLRQARDNPPGTIP